MNNYDAIVIGGGPAGSTAANIISQGGKSVLVLEREEFPRFHIGESLLPATVQIFRRLGIEDAIREHGRVKPGAVWFYGEEPVFSDFELCRDKDAIFADSGYAYMVLRSEFDNILLDAAKTSGAEVRFNAPVRDVLKEDNQVVGVKAVVDGAEKEIRCKMVFDSSGQRALISNKFGIRKETDLRRMAIYGHIKAEALSAKVQQSWFTGELIHNGWIWLIPLPNGLISDWCCSCN